jgi:glycosyltransferase involved in cell wall biosynthesis
MTGRGVIFDLVAAQSPSYRGRGIARYSTELVRAMVRVRPDLVAAIVLHPELPVPEGLDDLADWLTDEPDWASASVLHLSSVFELEVPVRTFWPREASANRLLTAVTLYDLIPDLFPGWYLQDPGLRRRWRCCREVVRAADTVLTPSESAKQDTIALLGLPSARVEVIGSGTSPAFRPPISRKAAFEAARQSVDGLQERFIIYNGAFNRHKNVDNLINGYASMPARLIDQHQLVIVCEAPPLTRNHYLVMAQQMGLEGRVLITGFVPEDVLVNLHQSAALGVFPSYYEGYGLPVIESMACGTPNIAADNSSIREILPREARFQVDDPWAIAEALERGLTDTSFRKRLIALADHEPPTWQEVAEKAGAAFDRLLGRARRSRPGWRRLPLLALVGTPPELADTAAAMSRFDRFELPGGSGASSTQTDGPVRSPAAPDASLAPEAALAPSQGAPDEGPPIPYRSFKRLDAWRGGYDAVVTWVSERSPASLEAMEVLAPSWPGRCIALVDAGNQDFTDAALSTLMNLGVRSVVLDDAADWQQTARLVIEAAGVAGV